MPFVGYGIKCMQLIFKKCLSVKDFKLDEKILCLLKSDIFKTKQLEKCL